MRNNIKECVIEEAKYIIDTKKTIREASKYFGISKSTIHKDLNERLFHINKDLYDKVYEILNEHLEIRHINGGIATKKKYDCIAKCNVKEF